MDFAQCGAATGKVCNGLLDATACGVLSEECMWCGEQSVCRSIDGDCDAGPPAGVGNPCKDATDADSCAAAGEDVCVFCEDAGNCVKVQKGCRVTGNPCKDAEDIDQCNAVAGGTLCSWCAAAGICTRGGGSCGSGDSDDDSDEAASGDEGVKGNPCKDATSEEGCMEINDALGLDACQYCSDQSKCKKTNDICDFPSGEVDLGLQERKAQFSVFDSGLGQTDENQVSVVLQRAEEKTADGTPVEGHAVDADDSEFTISQIQGIVFTGVEARKVSFASQSEGNGGTVKMDVFQFMSDGEVVNDDEVYSVRAGDIKFNLELENWGFCDGEDGVECASESPGMYVDIAVKIKGRDKPNGSGLMFDLGGNVPLTLSNKVTIDGSNVELPEGFPQFESGEEGDDGGVFMFRIPRFTQSAVYDPVIEYADATYEEYESTSGGLGSVTSLLTINRASALLFGGIIAIMSVDWIASCLSF